MMQKSCSILYTMTRDAEVRQPKTTRDAEILQPTMTRDAEIL